jgi:hypothetical protein
MQHELLVFAWEVKKNERHIMSGLKTNAMSRSEILTAMRSMPTNEDFIWDGIKVGKPESMMHLNNG